MAGQKVLQKENINTFNGAYKLILPILLKGVYNVVAHIPEGIYIKRIIVE
jgi:hypothetical protein